MEGKPPLEEVDMNVVLEAYEIHAAELLEEMEDETRKTSGIPPDYPWKREREFTAVPDPDYPSPTDYFYHSGRFALSYVPSLKRFLENSAPPEVSLVKGGVERTCCLLLLVQLFVMGTYVYTFISGYTSCRAIRYLSLVENNLCSDIKLSMNDQYSLDDNGFWDTTYEWAFSDTMVAGAFVDFSTSQTEWEGAYAKELWKVFDNWNNKWSTQPSVDNLMAMVVSEGKVSGDKLLLARVVADPKALMNANYIDAIAFNMQRGGFVMEYADRGNSFRLSASKSKWSEFLPKWKFVENYESEADITKGVTVNKYSLWVAGAVNMGIISIDHLTDLTDTSFANSYAVPSNDDTTSSGTSGTSGGEGGDDDLGAALSGVVCRFPSYYRDSKLRSLLFISHTCFIP